ncbi:MAG: flagellar basal body L-ring protein FlgH [Phycisphaerae bacterium]
MRWIGVAALLVLASAASAQSNSLLKRRPARPTAPLVSLPPVVAGMAHSAGGAAAAPVGGAQPAGGGPPTHAAPLAQVPPRGFPVGRATALDPPPMPVLGAAPPFVRQSPAAVATEEVANPVLQAVSPIAVSLPPPQKIGVNDLVTIIIREDKQATVDAKMNSDREWKVNAALAKWFRIHDQKWVPQTFPNGIPEADFELDSQYGGEGKTNRKESLVTRITARVLDVKPNGNLVLEARKEVNSTGDERQIMTLTGECRSRDVTNQNTVLSTQLADLRIDTKESGAMHDATQRGWIKRLFDFAKPL